MSQVKFVKLCKDIGTKPILLKHQTWIFNQGELPDYNNVYDVYMFNNPLLAPVHREKLKKELIALMRNFFVSAHTLFANDNKVDIDVESFVDLFCVMTRSDLLSLARRVKVYWIKFILHPCKTCKMCKANDTINTKLTKFKNNIKKRKQNKELIDEYQALRSTLKKCWKVNSFLDSDKTPKAKFSYHNDFTYTTTVTYPDRHTHNKTTLYFDRNADVDGDDVDADVGDADVGDADVGGADNDADSDAVGVEVGNTYPVTRDMPRELVLDIVFKEWIRVCYLFGDDTRAQKCLMSFILGNVLNLVDVINSDKILSLA